MEILNTTVTYRNYLSTVELNEVLKKLSTRVFAELMEGGMSMGRISIAGTRLQLIDKSLR